MKKTNQRFGFVKYDIIKKQPYLERIQMTVGTERITINGGNIWLCLFMKFGCRMLISSKCINLRFEFCRN